MYSPKIPDRLIPGLYRTARSRGLPMTRLVADVLESYLASHEQKADDPPLDRMGSRLAAASSRATRMASGRLTPGGLVDAPDIQSH